MMHEFPPAPEAQVTLANWRTAPFNKWAFHHVREVVPSADIVASDPANEAEFFEPAADKAYRFPTSYELPADVDHM